MSTVTAHVLVGQEHLYHGGINPTNHIALMENSRPVLLLDTFMADDPDRKTLPRWIPTLEHMMDDIMLMVAVFILDDKDTINLLKEAVPKDADWRKWLELYDIEEAERLNLYHHVKSLSVGCAMIFTVLEGSHLIQLKDMVKEYPFSIEILIAGSSTE